MSRKSILEFIEIYEKLFQVKINYDEAALKAEKLLRIIKLLNSR